MQEPVPLYMNVGGKPKLSLAPGQLGVFDLTSKPVQTVMPGDTPKRFGIAVGVDTTGDGLADSAMWSFGGESGVDACGVNFASATPPSCGAAEVMDVLIDCVQCDETYTLHIGWDDNSTRQEFPFLQRPKETYTARVSCDLPCEDCQEADAHCNDIVCQWIEKIYNQGFKDDYCLLGVDKNYVRRGPYTVHKLYDTSYSFCFTSSQGGCDGTCSIESIVGISIDGVLTSFTMTTDPSNPSTTLIPQIDSVISQINAALGERGSAAYRQGTGGCCDVCIEINTCAIIDGLDDGEGLLSVEPTNPLAPVDVDSNCVDCDPQQAQKTFACGVRIVADPLKLDCPCDSPPNPYIFYQARHLEAWVQGFDSDSYHIRYTSKGTLPVNSGYQMKQMVYEQATGGDKARGKQRPFNMHRGPHKQPLDISRNSNAFNKVDCNQQYCTIEIGNDNVSSKMGVGTDHKTQGVTAVVVPSADATTIASLLASINPIITAGCCALESVSCDGDDGVGTITGTDRFDR
jgi:hypothetical protein